MAPNSAEAELGVLACCLLDPKRSVAKCVEGLKFGGEEFYDLRYQTVYQAMVELSNSGSAVDVVTLTHKLKESGDFERVGGFGLLSTLPEQAPNAENLPSYLEVLTEKHALRKMLRICQQFALKIQRNGHKAADLIEQVERAVLGVRFLGGSAIDIDPAALVVEVMDGLETMAKRGGAVDGLATGFVDLDRMTGGMHEGEMIVLAGETGRGKTSLALNIVDHVLIELGEPVGVFSLEMNSQSLVRRLISSRARVNLRNVREGFLAEREIPRLTRAAGKLAKAKVRFCADSVLTADQFRAKARRMKHELGVKLLVLDYLQLLSGGEERGDNRQEEVAGISLVVKATATELGVPVLALSQLNDQGRLRESRAIGQDADTVAILHEDGSSGNEQDYEGGGVPYVLDIRKQRNGPRGKVKLMFLPAYTRFENAAKVTDEDFNPPSGGA